MPVTLEPKCLHRIGRLAGIGPFFCLAETKLVEHAAGVRQDAMRAGGAEGAMGLPSVMRAELFEELQVAGIPDWCAESAPGGIRTPAHTDSKSAALSTELQAQPKGAAQDCPRLARHPSERSLFAPVDSPPRHSIGRECSGGAPKANAASSKRSGAEGDLPSAASLDQFQPPQVIFIPTYIANNPLSRPRW